MAKRTKWTVEEDEILVQAINANPHNKAKKPSREVSEKIGRSAKCCSNRWYQALSNPEHKSYVGCMFTMVRCIFHDLTTGLSTERRFTLLLLRPREVCGPR